MGASNRAHCQCSSTGKKSASGIASGLPADGTKLPVSSNGDFGTSRLKKGSCCIRYITRTRVRKGICCTLWHLK
jgi:hypothetical protein